MNKQYQALANKIKEYEYIVIFRRDNPDGNAYGSQLGLREILKTNFPDKKVYASGTNSEFLNPMGRMDNFDPSVLPQALGIVVDCPTTEWIDGNGWEHVKELVKIDNHPEKEQYGAIDINDQSISSTSELIADIAFDLKWLVTPLAAQNLLIGALESMQDFWSAKFNKKTFLILAKLIELSPDVNEIVSRRTYSTQNENDVKKYLVNHIRTKDNLTYVYIPYHKLEKYQVEPNRAATFMWLLLTFSTTEFTAMFIEYPDKKIRAHICSKTRPVNLFAARYGGWGTEYSAGAFLESKKEIKPILETLEQETF
ncbi:DHH family phosphoesterase [Mesoplasma lactucae]|uniref:Uncharacterized protein n=1 Tax=Mesoplasma lactucae ATCC 49193 TaxID=81460 RepID=A0A291IS21_9MOLU|nr:DHH family phosphoesterase [Mesoplasma lactucae]ATG97573.1 hypothetical protein CP520_02300 [Mesoplasma lactucae ATCC 49193]ATZ19968.1 hypothetical protein MLACT_v1c01460 [Mesoplasma lactucae ATCC 49193]MCL8217081.1 putative bifunctional oligoribonuclease and PAP phosphatase NrnA [Mesoplasma lactucae ATCC 49193]